MQSALEKVPGVSLVQVDMATNRAVVQIEKGKTTPAGLVKAVDDIENMTVEQARKLYRIHFWDKYNYDKVSDFIVAARCFDMTVNMGAKQTGKIVQRALNNLGNSLKVDGAIGKNTFATINCTDPEMLMSEIRQEHAQFYINLIAAKPKFEKYRKGWLRRAAA